MQDSQVIWALDAKDMDKIDSLCNYAMAGPPTMTHAPSNLSLFVATIFGNSLESCWIDHAPSIPNDIPHRTIAFLDIKIHSCHMHWLSYNISCKSKTTRFVRIFQCSRRTYRAITLPFIVNDELQLLLLPTFGPCIFYLWDDKWITWLTWICWIGR